MSEWADEINPKDSILDGRNYEIFTTITKGINGGTNGLKARAANYVNIEDEYSKVKRMIKQWFTRWWGVALIGTLIIGSSVVLYKQLNK